MQAEANSQVLVRQLNESDLMQVDTILADQELAQAAGLSLSTHPAARRWAIQNWFQQEVLWGIEVEDQLIGLIALFSIAQGRELGYLLQKSWWNQGIMTKAVGQVLVNYQDQVIVAYTREVNLPSQAVLIANSFQKVAQQAGIIKWSTCKMSVNVYNH